MFSVWCDFFRCAIACKRLARVDAEIYWVYHEGSLSLSMCMCVCVSVCDFIEMRITGQPGPAILIFQCYKGCVWTGEGVYCCAIVLL